MLISKAYFQLYFEFFSKVSATNNKFYGEYIMSAVMSADGLEFEEQQIAELLECRFGDGMVYLPKTKPRQLLYVAVINGFIDTEGYLTRKGRMLLARYF